MRRLSPRLLTGPLIVLVALAGCVTVQAPGEPGRVDPVTRYRQVLDSIAVARSLGEEAAAAAPRIRLVVPPGALSIMQYVDASFHVTDDAYVLVVAVDLDRRVRVLHPESPDESGFAARSRSHRLTRFFAGFGGPRLGGQRYYDASNRISPTGGGGVLLAVASDRPLQLQRLMGEGGDWDERALSRLIFEQSLPGAAHEIGRALVLTGQEYNTDYSTFHGRRMLGTYSTLASNSFDGCPSGYGFVTDSRSAFEYGGEFDAGMTAFIGLYQRDGRTYARYAYGTGSCSRPLYYDVPVRAGPFVPRDTTARDSTVMTSRPPRFPGAPRFPSVAGDDSTAPIRRRVAGSRVDGERVRLQPPVSGGLRFRPPEHVPVEVMRARSERLPAPDSESPARRRPRSSEDEAMRPSAPERRAVEETRRVERPEPVERRAEPRTESKPREPVQREPVQREPEQREPVRREPVRREPARTAPTPH